MRSRRARRARLVLLALLATLAWDLADADCVKASLANDAICASSAGDCACCVLSEVAADGAHLPMPYLQTGGLPAPLDQPRAGVRPVPYRPPLALS